MNGAWLELDADVCPTQVWPNEAATVSVHSARALRPNMFMFHGRPTHKLPFVAHASSQLWPDAPSCHSTLPLQTLIDGVDGGSGGDGGGGRGEGGGGGGSGDGGEGGEGGSGDGGGGEGRGIMPGG